MHHFGNLVQSIHAAYGAFFERAGRRQQKMVLDAAPVDVIDEKRTAFSDGHVATPTSAE
jgi:hypothetical protein